MKMSLKEVCKLCMKYIHGDELVMFTVEILEKLRFLQLDLSHCVEDNSSICEECKEKIENVTNFKSCLVINKTIHSMNTYERSSENIVCHLCKNSVDELSVISLLKLCKDDGRIIELFQRHIEELDLEHVVKSTMVCEMCQKSIASFSTLVSFWQISSHSHYVTKDKEFDFEKLEEKIDKNIISNSNPNSSRAFAECDRNSDTIKKEHSSNDGGGGTSDDDVFLSKNIKREEFEENEESQAEEIQLKNEELDIKEEDRSLVSSAKHEDSHEENTCNLQIYNCDLCSFETKYKRNLKTHKLKHRSVNELPIYNCEKCHYRTDYKGNLKKHMVKHKSSNELAIYNCENCSYRTDNKKCLKSHMLSHKSINELSIYHCEKCAYETKYKGNLKTHMLNHKSLNELPTYDCKKCSYETKFERNLKRHMLKHKNIMEVPLYRCDKCAFETKYRGNMKRHVLTHQSITELEILNYKKCSSGTKYKRILNIMLKHKILDEVDIYRCEKCSFCTKYKHVLKRHFLKHRTLDGIKCFVLTYKQGIPKFPTE